MSIEKDRSYSKSHEWVKTGDDGVAVIGISDYAQESLGDITFVELPESGKVLSKGDAFGVVESVKAASDLYAPVSGEVVDVNGSLEDAPEKVNESPYEDGWLIKIKLSDPTELDALLDAGEYEKETG